MRCWHGTNLPDKKRNYLLGQQSGFLFVLCSTSLSVGIVCFSLLFFFFFFFFFGAEDDMVMPHTRCSVCVIVEKLSVHLWMLGFDLDFMSWFFFSL